MTPKSIPHCRIASCSRHTATRIRSANVGSSTSRWELGVSKRVEYGSVVCVSPVASCRCAGIVFGGIRRFSRSGFSKVSSRRRVARSCASPGPSRQAALRSSSLSAHRARVALGCRRGANAGPGAWPTAMPAPRRAPLPAVWPRPAGSVHLASSPKRAVTSAAIPPAVEACGARDS